MRLLAPLRNRDFALLFTGGMLSLIGDGIYLVAIAFQVLELSNSATSLSLVLLAWYEGRDHDGHRAARPAAVFAALRGVQQIGEVIWFSLQLKRVPGFVVVDVE